MSTPHPIFAVAQMGDYGSDRYRTRDAAQQAADRLNADADDECGPGVMGDGAASVVETDEAWAVIHERGNGFPDVGDYVQDDGGDLHRVVVAGSRITTGNAMRGESDACHGYVLEPSDWEGCDEVHPCGIEIVDAE